MRNIFTRLTVVSLLLLVTATVSAQLTSLEVGQVYRFVSARADRSLSADGTADVHTKTTDAADTKQEWYVTKDGDYYVLRNLACGKYLKGAYSAGTDWSMTDDYSDQYNKFELYTSNSTYNTLKTYNSNGYGYMHDDANGDDGGYNIVGWLNGSTDTGTQWTITKVDYTTEQITALLEKAPTTAELAVYSTALGELFSDAACVTPKLASLSAAQATDAYDALPTALQAMVVKVYNEKDGVDNPWGEANADNTKEAWGSVYAKKFRVQMYEPYSIAGDITSWLGINAHANNDNPTGIHVPEAGTLYVMVEGTVEDGASLRLINGGHNWRVTNATGDGYELQPGLNVINFTETAGQLYICYNVDTYNPDGATTAEKFPHKLSDYAPLKIHIEGGAITGYYNACGDFRAADSGTEDLWKTITGASVDNDEDWEYMEERANLNVIPLLAHRQILLFHLNDYTHDDGGVSPGMKSLLPDQLDIPETPYSYAKTWDEYGMGCDASTGKINIMLEAWDRIMYSELATMGLVSQSTMQQMNDFYPRWESDYKTRHEMYDYEGASPIDNKTYQEFCNGLDYSEYFNHHGVALGTESGYMYGSWDHCGYSVTTYGGIVQSMANNAGSTWGPAHEIGHQHQAPLTLNGLTEVTNNLFSNIALWYKGMSTSRYNGDNGSLESVLAAYNTEGSDIYTNNIWALTHLYYRLWLYYHLAGNNTQFYPRLFELLRQQPMQKGYNVSGDVSTLHFYKLACQAAGEDLTEFFRAHGYFSIMDDRLVGDYANSVYEVSEVMIEEAIAEVKEMGYEENLAIILICDDDENAAYVQHDGTSKREIYGETTPDSDYGSVSDFINGNVSVETAYTATLNSDGTLTMSGGEGGVGFFVLNEEGEIVSFSNKSTFAISDEAAYLLATGKATVVAVDTESNTTDAEVDATAMRFALLQDLIDNANVLTEKVSETRVGYYKAAAVTSLTEYVEMAEEVIATNDLVNLQAVYEMLYNEYNAVVANEYSRVTLVPGSKYAIISVKSSDRILTFTDSNVTTVSDNADAYSTNANYQWYIERDGAYHIKNAGTSKYMQDVTDENGVLYTVGDNKVNMNINEVALGCYTIATSTVPGRYINMDGADEARIITWGDAYSENSQWAFILLEADDTNAAKEELLELSKKTLALVNEVATVSYNEGSKIALQSSSSTTANYIWSNAAVSGNDVDKLLDSDKETFFHSQWSSTTAPTDGWGHHISVDLGENPTLTSFKFKFTTRNASNLSNYPKTIEVYGSNVGGDDVANYTKLQEVSGFATGAGVDNEAVVMGNGTAYRYLRFLVTDATGNNAGINTGSDGMVFFHMSEFSIYPVTVSVTVKDDYTSSVTAKAVSAAYNDAEQAKSVYHNTAATLDDINAKKTALGDGTAEGSYTTLLAQYNNVLNSVLDAKKAQLQKLIDDTEDLIGTVGSVEFTDVPFALTTENLYCNDPCLRNDADYSAEYVDKLTDGNHATYLHTDWDNSNSAGTTPHYLRVDMGEGETIRQFIFTYTTRNNGNNCPTTIVVEGSNDADGNGTYTPITTLTKDANNLPVEYDTFTSPEITSQVSYRYIRFMVTATESDDLFFVMSEFGFTKANQSVVTMTDTSTKADEALVFDTYLATTKSQKLHDAATAVALLDAAIADQQAAYDELDKAINTPADLDKSALEELVALAQPLYNKMATDGVVNVDYAPSALTNAQLIAASDALAAANEALASATSQAVLDEAKTALQTAYDALLAVENANEKSSLATTELETLIGQVETLLGTIATDATDVKVAIPLQTAEGSDYYINVAATGDGSVANLIDKDADGTGITSSYYGSHWDPAPEAFSQYIEVDMGTAIRIDKLLFDYTTRDGSQTTERPNAIRISGSNNGVDYTEVTTIDEGLATGQCEQWTMTSPLALNRNYRYIRFTVDSERHSFHMSDFNLYALIDKQLNDYYTTATGLGFDELCLALQSAKDAISRHYLTTAQYTAIKDKLNSVYNNVSATIALNYTTRDGLTTLITDTEALINKVATVNGYAKTVQLQCSDPTAPNYLYCNAPGGTNTWDGDNAGVAALIDLVDGEPNISTYMHTTYEGDDYYDELDHYLRVDAGEGNSILAFKFNYNCRQGYGNNSPKVILIEGANDLNGEFEEITTLSDLPTDNYASYESALISNGKPYRYIRFMVKETTADDTHPFFSMSHFGMTSCIDAMISEDYPKVTPELLLNVYEEKLNASDANTRYMLEASYNDALAALQADYDALNDATVADKTALEELIAATEALKSQLYKQTYTQGEALALQADDSEQAYYLYCNAPESNASSVDDNVGVSALIDSDENNYLHTEWTGEQSFDGLDHYLRVDLGEDGRLSDFVFSYESARNLPRTFVVEGCNTADGEYERIGLYVGANTTNTLITTGLFSNGNEYRYLRFRVIATHEYKKDNSGYHYFFVLNDFDVYPVSNIVVTDELKDEYASTIYIYNTSELVTDVTDGITQAQGVVESADANQGAVDAEVEALQAVYDKLEEALKYAVLPVTITTDEANPVLYNIISKRATDDSKVLQYCESDAANPNTVSVSDKVDNNSYQAWYFMKGDNGYLIKPFNGDGKVLAADDTSNGHTKVWAAEEDTKNYDEWTFVSRADGYYNIEAHDRSNYFSNNGGPDYKMGFWSGDPDTDAGSLFKFVEAEFENDNARYYQLSDVKETMIDGTNIYGGTSVGLYTGGKEYREAYTAATALVTTGNSSASDECYAAYKALREAKENLAYNAPDAEKLYVIKSMSTAEYCSGKYVHTYYAKNADHNYYNHKHLVYHNYDDITNKALAVFKFEETGTVGKYKMKNLYTGLYVKTFEKNQDLMGTQSEAQDVYITGFADGQVTLNINNQAPMHAQEANTLIVHWKAEAGNASLWTIDEITALEDLTYTTTMSQLGYGTLMLGYDVKVPAGITANAAKEVNGNGKYITFESIGDVIPANTAVILKSKETLSEALTLKFEYEGNSAVALEDNMLCGSLYDTTINGVDNNIYQMQANNGTVKFYWMYAEYDEAGELTYAGTDDGGYVKLPANKAYFSMPKGEGASSYSFRFPWEGTTDIEGIVAEDNDALNGTIFDLQGRKIVEITEPGFYIINGKKVFVEEIK